MSADHLRATPDTISDAPAPRQPPVVERMSWSEVFDNDPADPHAPSEASEGAPDGRVDGPLLDPERRRHILDGDDTGGGHRPGTGRPGKTEFPPSWDDDTICAVIIGIAHQPDTQHEQWNGKRKLTSDIEDVKVTVIIDQRGKIDTAWPHPGGDGVIRNPRHATEPKP